MKRIGTMVSMMIMVSSLAGSVFAADNVIVKKQAGDDYCHMKFPAIDENTMAGIQPQLKPSAIGDVGDFYGPCDESPTEKDQVREQKLEESVTRSLDYVD